MLAALFHELSSLSAVGIREKSAATLSKLSCLDSLSKGPITPCFATHSLVHSYHGVRLPLGPALSILQLIAALLTSLTLSGGCAGHAAPKHRVVVGQE